MSYEGNIYGVFIMSLKSDLCTGFVIGLPSVISCYRGFYTSPFRNMT